MEELLACPVCDSQGSQFYMETEDFTVSHEKFKIVKCIQCGFLFTNPRPSVENLGSYYKSESYISHSDTSKGLINKLYKVARRFTLRRKSNLVKPYISSKKVLDIGAGTGAFVNELVRRGFKAVGIEPDQDAVKLAASNYGIALLPEKELESLPAGSFDAITMWHVLEHVPFLQDRVKTIARLLSQDGAVFIAVPNYESYDAQYYKEHWAAYDVPRHLYHFDKQTIERLFLQNNLILKQIKPMPLDGFYVSMLSEQYKSGRNNILKGLFRGMISYFSAGNKNTSSLIYVFRHKGTN